MPFAGSRALISSRYVGAPLGEGGAWGGGGAGVLQVGAGSCQRHLPDGQVSPVLHGHSSPRPLVSLSLASRAFLMEAPFFPLSLSPSRGPWAEGPDVNFSSTTTSCTTESPESSEACLPGRGEPGPVFGGGGMQGVCTSSSHPALHQAASPGPRGQALPAVGQMCVFGWCGELLGAGVLA